jgi:site-specific DNA-adenine methylase
MKTKSALSYFGSDSEVASELAGMLDHCNHVTIPFVGGGAIIPYLKARAIVANDLNDLAINFYRVLSDRCGAGSKDELIWRCQLTLSHPSEMSHAVDLLSEPMFQASFIEKAWAYWVLCWVGRKGAGGTGSLGKMPSVRWTADGGNNASRINAAANDLHEWANELKRCEWTQIDFREVLKKCKDQPKCGIYADAPWPGAGDAYLHPFKEQDHIDLRDALDNFEHATIVVRYGDDPSIRDLYREWRIIDAASRTQSNAVKGEIWITNKESK